MHNTAWLQQCILYNIIYRIIILFLWVLIDFRFPLKFLAPLVVMISIIFKVGKS